MAQTFEVTGSIPSSFNWHSPRDRETFLRTKWFRHAIELGAPVLGPLLAAGDVEFSSESLDTKESVKRLKTLLVHSGALTRITLRGKLWADSPIPPELPLSSCTHLKVFEASSCDLDCE